MNRIFQCIFAFALLALFAVSAVADIIPPDRQATNIWKIAGIPGGIPTTWTTNVILESGKTNTIGTALASCPANQIVQLTNGIYYQTTNVSFDGTTVSLNVQGNNVTLRGAGMGKSIIKFINSADKALNIGTRGNWSGVPVISCAKNSSNAVVSSVTGFKPGQFIAIDMANIDWIQPIGSGGSNTGQYGKQSSDSGRCQVHYARLTRTNGTTLTFWPPIAYDIDTNRSPMVSYNVNYGCTNVGFEDLTFDYTGWSGTYPSRIQASSFVWFKNVEYTNWYSRNAIWFTKCSSCEVRSCFFHDSIPATSADHGYGILADGISGSLFIDNSFCLIQSNMLLQNGADGNVVAYNALTFVRYKINPGDLGFLQHSINGSHSTLPVYNLYEGNYMEQFQSDYFYGGSGWGTLFRNRISGNGWRSESNQVRHITVLIDSHNRYYNVVGNSLGETNVWPLINLKPLYLQPRTIQYTQTLGSTWAAYDMTTNSQLDKTIYRLGFDKSGGNDTANYDTNILATTLRHLNWDVYTGRTPGGTNGGVVYDPTITNRTIEDSMFLTTKPTWFGTNAWPPYGPSAGVSVSNDLARIPAGYRLLYGTNPPISTLTISPQNVVTGYPACVQFSATNDFGSGNKTNVTASATWTATDPLSGQSLSSINFTAPGTACIVMQGPFKANINASWSNWIATALLEVTNPAPVVATNPVICNVRWWAPALNNALLPAPDVPACDPVAGTFTDYLLKFKTDQACAVELFFAGQYHITNTIPTTDHTISIAHNAIDYNLMPGFPPTKTDLAFMVTSTNGGVSYLSINNNWPFNFLSVPLGCSNEISDLVIAYPGDCLHAKQAMTVLR